ncbi:uncharacterized protein LOC135712376 [Ochlerotatus camptorhynchus]|uniref:uncharacterized protein LOC135712376 n=1 Tax=Ochlerotatus camptorhynchus TaxID=644619 RepID=UPI0031D915A5
MVFCDNCQKWYHFGCAGVTEEVRDVSWSCPECKIVDVGDAGSSELQEELKKLEEEKKRQKQELEREKILYRKRLEMQQEMFEMRQQLEKEKREMELEFEKTQMKKKLVEEEAHQKKLDEMRTEMEEKLELLKMKRNKNTDGKKVQEEEEEEAESSEKRSSKKKKQKKTKSGEVKPEKSKLEKKKSGKEKPGNVDPPAVNAADIRGAYRKHSTPKVAKKPAKKPVERPISLPESFLIGRDKNDTPFGHPEVPKKKKDKNNSGKLMNQVKGVLESDSSESSEEEESSEVEEKSSEAEEESSEEDSSESEEESSESSEEDHNQRDYRRRVRHRHQKPTKAQLSSRHFLSRKLPTFSGKLEEWPMFISSYETSTKACGFSNVENLARLQECLKGEALEAVRSRLLLPKAVPKIIETLRMLFGRPEGLLNMLLIKIRNAAPPKAERLASFISFGVVVQQLADHLEATGLTAHLVNPMLIQELTDKLPAGTQMEWVRYRRKSAIVTIRTLSDFLSNIVKDASEVTSFGEAARFVEQRPSKGKSKREHEGYLHAHSGVERSQSPPVKERKPCRICERVDHRIRNCERFRKLRLADRWEAVRKWNLCQLCLNEHGNLRCKLNFRCNVSGCNDRHNPLLHPVGSVAGSNCNIHAILPKPSVIFRMMPVTLYCGKFSVNTIAFLDEGSSYTLVEKPLISKLGVRGVTQPLRVTWTAGVSRIEKDSQRVDLFISALGSAQRFQIKSAHTVESLKLPQHTLSLTEIVKQYSHLHGVPVTDFQQATPQILIGLKDIHLYAPIESRIGRPEEPIAVRSKLGWTVYGPTGLEKMDGGMVGHHRCSTLSNQELHDLLRNNYTLEESGISVALLPESEEVRRAKEILEKTTVRVGDRFETGLLWKEDDPHFPDSYPMAVKRLQCMERRMQNDSNLYNKVRSMIGDYLAKGYAHIATPSELAAFDYSKVWYVPLNIVYNPRKQKYRLVWDARAEVKGVSLNSKLLKGPDMLTALPAVICRFRERVIGFGADIKEMYHQMKMREVDKRVLRFLFRDNPSMAPVVYVMDVATFGSTCSPSSAQYVKNLNAKEYARQFPEAAEKIVKNHYVDDYFDSANTVDEAVKVAKEVRYVHSKGGFELRNWVSNSEMFLQAMGERKANQCVRFNEDKESGSERVLGIVWSPASDEFSFSTKLRDDLAPYLSGELLPTKRIVMSCVMSFFDPLGLLSIFTFYGKLLIQDLWRSGCEWDQQIDQECAEKWSQWITRLPEVEEVRVPRYYFQGGCIGRIDFSSIQLHVFVDASENAFGAAAYLRIETANGPLCSLVMARSKVAPLKHLSIPRLELQAAVLGARLANSVVEILSLQIKQRFIWSDSKTVLSWIQSDHRRYKQFVAFRIGEILNLTKLEEWRWVPTRCNVADAMTKWEKKHSLCSDGPWFRAPHFLYRSEEQWPEQHSVTPNVSEEIRACLLFHDVTVTEPMVDPQRFSRWKVLVRTVACAYRFVSNCRRKRDGLRIEAVSTTENAKKVIKRSLPATKVPLQREEYRKAEVYLWRSAQADCFMDEVKVLMKNRELPYEEWHQLEKSSYLHNLSPFLDEQDVLRMEGRVARGSSLPFELRFPIILPKKHPVTNKLLEYYHQQVGHGNMETAVNEIRQRFHIQNLRAEMKRIVRTCVWCKVRKCQPKNPRMAPLPKSRVTPNLPPFSHTGVDYCGPFIVTVGRRSEKRYVCLFTCMSTRAVHLEVAHSLTTQACLMAIRRFVCRKGKPLEFYSDNGTNFQAASKEIMKRIESECEDAFTDSRTRWNFNPPSAPHMGGVWERLVRSLKAALNVLNDGRTLTDEVLLTTLAEAEDLINSRPLTYVSLEPGVDEALTPNHFVRGVGAIRTEHSVQPTNEADALRDRYKRSQLLADKLWTRWISEYLPSINQRTKWHSESVPLERGDLVYIADDTTRKNWIRGIVVETYQGADGRIRQAVVKTAKGEFRRPVAKLAVLEVQDRKSGVEGTPPELRGGGMCAPPSTMDTSCDVLYQNLKRR